MVLTDGFISFLIENAVRLTTSQPQISKELLQAATTILKNQANYADPELVVKLLEVNERFFCINKYDLVVIIGKIDRGTSKFVSNAEKLLYFYERFNINLTFYDTLLNSDVIEFSHLHWRVRKPVRTKLIHIMIKSTQRWLKDSLSLMRIYWF